MYFNMDDNSNNTCYIYNNDQNSIVRFFLQVSSIIGESTYNFFNKRKNNSDQQVKKQ